MKSKKILLLAAALIFSGHTAFADAVLSVIYLPNSLTVGQQFTVSIDVTGPTVSHSGQTFPSDVADLDAFQFDLAFNCAVAGGNSTSCAPGSNILSALSVTEGSFLPNGGLNPTFFEPGAIDNSTGLISLIGDVGASGVTGSGTLVNITFQALQAGTTSIAILANNDLQFYDSNGNPIVIDDSVTTSPSKDTFPTNQSLSTTVTVAPVPEPPSGQLLLLGGSIFLLGLSLPRHHIQ
ncbi:cohesin domain-containing protein [Edaphobacter flagellatus]|uniref:cohesin domain-containing protein n=1 Tax=Edaphobacter flagellatus TaxID=1933044 RepID=UPI0021B19274|nr:cohesin domain-containing protein [Edaphobacter flagellatus]